MRYCRKISEAWVKVPRWRQLVLASMVLALLTWLAYAQVITFDFVNYDDQVYVTENLELQRGFSMETFRWLLTTNRGGNWHPLTWISHLIDYELFGLDAGMHHLSNLLYHLANTVLLFVVMVSLTGSFWRSWMVAALFGLHPLHVESVAWISERKDTLSTLFWLLTMLAYGWYLRARGTGSAWRRYAVVLLSFAGGLMSKSMVVTLPCVLLLLDVWPLRRIQLGVLLRQGVSWRLAMAILDKLPMLGLGLVVAAVTMVTQRGVGAMADHVGYPIRVGNALLSYGRYLQKCFWPLDLHIFYPHPMNDLNWGLVVLSTVILLFLTGIILAASLRYPYLGVGWFWYLGTLVPVIGLIQVGEQAMADRYTYVPLIGIFIMAAWGVPELVKGRWRVVLPAVSVVVVGVCMVLTWRQAGYWRNTQTLFERALAITPDNFVAHGNLATLKAEREEYETALAHFREVLKVKPRSIDAVSGIGAIYYKQGKVAEAREYMESALAINPKHAETHLNYGILLADAGDHLAALKHYRLALANQRQDMPELLYSLALSLQELDQLEEAEGYAEQALQLSPEEAKVHNLIGILLRKQEQWPGARAAFERALALDPGLGEAWYNLGLTHEAMQELEQAAEAYRRALESAYESERLHYNLALIYHLAGDLQQAIAHYRQAISLNEAYVRAHHNLGAALNLQGQRQVDVDPAGALARFNEATVHYQRAIALLPQDANMRNSYAVNLIYLGHYAEAIAQLERALELEPQNLAVRRTLEEARRLAAGD